MKDGLKHPKDGGSRHMPHLAKVHKASKKGLVETPMTKIGPVGKK